MNPQELYIDVSSGRFLDGESTIPVARPSIYSDEQKTLDVSVLRVKNNVLSKWNPSAKSKYKIRLGTAEHKLADGIEPTTAPPQLFTATAIVVTRPAFGIKGTGTVYTYSPVTATFVASLTPTQGVTANISLSIYNPPKVTAVITASVGATISTQSIVRPLGGNGSITSVIGRDGRSTGETKITYPPNEVPVDGRNNPALLDPATNGGSGLQGIPASRLMGVGGDENYVCTFESVLGGASDATATASFGAGILNGVTLTARGSNYPSGNIAPKVSGGRSPSAATFTVIVNNGSVSTIAISSAGAGYPNGEYDVFFTSGNASAKAYASSGNGSITNVVLTNAGSGITATTAFMDSFPATATFTVTVTNGSVSAIAISSIGAGYLNGEYDVFFTSGGASAKAYASNGSITNVVLTNAGSGITATTAFMDSPASVEAILSASVSGGVIESVTIVCAGSGYTSTPTIVFPSPRKSVIDVIPSNQVGVVGGKRRFMWVYGVDTTRTPLQERLNIPEEELPPTALRFTPPIQSASDASLASVPSATVRFVKEDPRHNIWEIDLISGGSGYTTAPVVTHDPAVCSTAKLKIRKYLFISEATRQTVFPGLAGFPPEADQENAFEIVLDRRTRTQIRNGGTFKDYNTVFPYLDQANKSKTAFSTDPSGPWRGELKFSEIQSFTSKFGSQPWKYAYAITGQDEATRVTANVGENDAFVVYNIESLSDSTIRNLWQSYYPGYDIRGLKTVPGQGDASPGPNGNLYTQIGFPKHDKFLGVPIFANDTNLSSNFFNPSVLSNYPQSYMNGYAGNFRYYTYGAIKNGTNGNLSVRIVRGAQKNTGYKVHFVGNARLTEYFKSRTILATVDGGGMFEAEIEYLDYGDGCFQTKGLSSQEVRGQRDAVRTARNGNFGLRTDVPFYVGSFGQTVQISMPTPGSTVLATNATIITRPLASGIGYFFGTPGYGYETGSQSAGGRMVITVSIVTAVTGFLKDVKLLNAPAGYSANDFECEIAAPPSGTTASVILRLDGGGYSAVLLDGGSGYVTAPIITAPAPDIIYGNVVEARVTNSPEGYSEGNTYFCEVGQSPSIGGDAVISLQNSRGQYSAEIVNPGFGYTSAPVVTAPGFEPANLGKIQSIVLSNTPVGYAPNQSFNLQIGSPTTGTTALGKVDIVNGRFTAQVLAAGFGYLTPPTITGIAPNADQGIIVGATVTCEGFGYPPGTYEVTFDAPPSGGVKAVAVAVVTQSGTTIQIQSSGKGYISSPSLSVSTPAGSAVSGITIVCRGNFYIPINANITLSDPTGTGAVLAQPQVLGGEIDSVVVLNSGFGYSKPTAVFTSPTAPEPEIIPPNRVIAEVNITTASANTILGTANQKDILLEVFETDGTDEQVVAQGTMSLSKRVKE